MNEAELVLCAKHNKKQANMLQISTNYSICMSRYCPQAYTILCDSCKSEHRDHTVKVLTVQDVSFLVERLLKTPFKQVSTFIVESVQILKKLKLVNEFSVKVSEILKELHQETMDLVITTENIIMEYSQCKNSTQEVAAAMFEMESFEAFANFRDNHMRKLNKIDYNIQKDRFEYGNLEIKEKEDARRKNMAYVRRKIEEVKEYSMKVIEVILNNDESDEQEEDFAKKKKLYESLKAQVARIYNKVQQREALQARITQEQSFSIIKVDKFTQTDKDQSEEYKDRIKNLEQQLESLQQAQKKMEIDYKALQLQNQVQKKSQTEYRNKITVLQKEKQNANKQKENLRKDKQKAQKQFEQKIEILSHYEKRLRDNFLKRNARYKQREELIKNLAELIEHQRRGESRGRDSVRKDRRDTSRTKVG